MENRKAIVVEDNLDLRTFLCAALRLEKVDAVGCADGDEALKYLEGCQPMNMPDFALVDFSLGEKTGAELIGRIRVDSRMKHMKIIMISGWQEVAPLAKEMGADGFLRKPFDFDLLCNLLGVSR